VTAGGFSFGSFLLADQKKRTGQQPCKIIKDKIQYNSNPFLTPILTNFMNSSKRNQSHTKTNSFIKKNIIHKKQQNYTL
jgi:DNA-binding protein Fis